MKYFCGSIDECVFAVDGICVNCKRKEPKPVKREDDEEVENSDDIEQVGIDDPDSWI